MSGTSLTSNLEPMTLVFFILSKRLINCPSAESKSSFKVFWGQKLNFKAVVWVNSKICSQIPSNCVLLAHCYEILKPIFEDLPIMIFSILPIALSASLSFFSYPRSLPCCIESTSSILPLDPWQHPSAFSQPPTSQQLVLGPFRRQNFRHQFFCILLTVQTSELDCTLFAVHVYCVHM